MRRVATVLLAAAALILASEAVAQTCPSQSSPNFTAGGSVFGRTAAQWSQYFRAKADANNGTLCNPTIIGGNVQVDGVVTSVGLLVPGGGIFSVTGSPVTLSGSFSLNLAGISGGIPFFSDLDTLSSSGALSLNEPVIGGGAGGAPSVGSRSGNTTTFATMNGSILPGNLAIADSDGNLIDGGSPSSACSGAGTACTADTGTSLHTLPFLDGDNTFSGAQTFAAAKGSSREDAGTAVTLLASDCGKTVIFTAGTTVTVTIPASIAPASGTSCNIALWQQGAGTVDVTGSAVATATRVSYGGFTQTAGQYAILGVSLTTISAVATANIIGQGA